MKSRSCIKSLSDIGTVSPFEKSFQAAAGLSGGSAFTAVDESYRIDTQGHPAVAENGGTGNAGGSGQVLSRRLDGHLLLPHQARDNQSHALVGGTDDDDVTKVF